MVAFAVFILSVPSLTVHFDRLCNIRFTSVRADIDLQRVTISSVTGDFNPTSLAHVINTETVNDLVVKTWLDRACEISMLLDFPLTEVLLI